jgi:hypothetical protein
LRALPFLEQGRLERLLADDRYSDAASEMANDPMACRTRFVFMTLLTPKPSSALTCPARSGDR